MPLSDYIINVFCIIDDIYLELFGTKGVRKAGYAPYLGDSEIISMLMVGELLGMSDNKKIWLYFKSNFLNYFPSISHVKYKIFNNQATNLWNVLKLIHGRLFQRFPECSLFLADGFPLPICHLARANRSHLFCDKTSRSYCAAKDEHYYGFKVLLVTTEQGIPVDYAIDAANVDERELLTRTKIPAHYTVIADKGFISKELTQTLKDKHGITLITPTRKNMLHQISNRFSKLITGIRKRIETTISQLTEIFSINKTKTRSLHGLLGRINRKILAYTTALFFNYQLVKDLNECTKLENLIQA
jgi:hypothetical protein